MASHGGQTGSPALKGDSPDLRSVSLLSNGLEAAVMLPPAPMSVKGSTRRSLAKKQDDSTAGLLLHKEWSASTTSWIVKPKDLKPLPAGFPLEKTHCTIEEDPSVVSERISGTLRDLSIDSTFCSKSAKVSCQTDDCVRFKIRMFAGGSDGQPVIVEVQKSCGSAFLFAQTCRMLLNAAKGSPPTGSRSGLKPRSLPPLSKMKCLEGVKNEANNRFDAMEQLQSVQRMLHSERADERWLAVENLCCLTDTSKSSAVVSTGISEGFLKDANLRSAVLLMLSPMDRAAGDYESYNRVSDPAKQHLPLMAFGNALERLHSSDSQLAELVEADAWYPSVFIPVLLNYIEREGQACVSYHGTRCLLALLMSCGTRHESEVAKTVTAAGGLEILLKVHERSAHQRLEHATRKCLDFLQGTINECA